MPTINFTQFIDKVISGEKRQTIRKMRKHPIKVGDKLYLYSGLRTKNAKNLLYGIYLSDAVLEHPLHGSLWGDWSDDDRDPQVCEKVFTRCKEVHDIEIRDISETTEIDGTCFYFDNKPMRGDDYVMLAYADGFDNGIDLFLFIKKTHGLPFKGQVVRW